jgi:hypothetical protein
MARTDLDDAARALCHRRGMVLLNEIVYRPDSYVRGQNACVERLSRW